MAQSVFVLANAAMIEGGLSRTREPGPSHVCEGASVCTYVNECDWLRRWRAAQERHAFVDEPIDEGIL